MTAPPGTGWTAVMVLTATQADGTERRWTEETAVLGETASYTVTPPSGDTGAVTLLSGRVGFVNVDGRELRARRLGGQFVASVDSAFAATSEHFSGAVGVGIAQDPHEGMVIADEDSQTEVVP